MAFEFRTPLNYLLILKELTEKGERRKSNDPFSF